MRCTQRWLQGGKAEPLYVEMYNRAMDEMIAKLVKKTRPSGLEVRSLAQCILSRPPPSASPRPICVSAQVLGLPSAAPSRLPTSTAALTPFTMSTHALDEVGVWSLLLW